MAKLTKTELAGWRAFLESALAMADLVDAELQAGCGLSLRWYDVLVHLEGAGDGIRMNELADRILASKSGLTRVVDRMDEAGLVRRERPPDDRRAVLVFITPEGRTRLGVARECHHASIRTHFTNQLDGDRLTVLADTVEHLRQHVLALRPGRMGD